MTYGLPDMRVLQDVHPRRDGLSETEVCCKFGCSADTLTDVLLIPKALAEKEMTQREEVAKDDIPAKESAKIDFAISSHGRRKAIDVYRKHVLAVSRAPEFFPKLVGRWRPTGKRVQFKDLRNVTAIHL